MPEADEFSAHRDHLMAVAYRMLGSRSDAEDAVQEAWLPAGMAFAGDLGAEDDPAERVVRLDEVSLALLVVLERLTPEQRVAFILHDVFAVPFDEIASVLGGTPEAARQLASRARRAVAEGRPRHRADLNEQRRVLSAFLNAAERGDVDALLAVLAPDVVAIGDGGGVAPAGKAPFVGALQVARFMAGIFRQAARTGGILEPVLVNGALGLLAEGELAGYGTVRLVMGFAIEAGRVTRHRLADLLVERHRAGVSARVTLRGDAQGAAPLRLLAAGGPPLL